MAFLVILVVPICIGAIVAAFFSTIWSWILIATAIAILLLSLIAVKLMKWKEIPELSEEANIMLKKFGHFYTMSDCARLHSSSSSAVQITVIIVAIINAFHSFWWGIPAAIVLYFVMGFVARAFNPTHFIRNPMEQIAHEEVLDYMRERMRKQFEDHIKNTSSANSPESTSTSSTKSR